MTTRDAIRCYVAAFPDDTNILDPSDTRRAEVADEMRAIVEAKTLTEARKLIAWWREYDGWLKGELTRTVNTIRRAAGVKALR